MEIPEKVVMITATDTFRRIASHCALRLVNYRVNESHAKYESPKIQSQINNIFHD